MPNPANGYYGLLALGDHPEYRQLTTLQEVQRSRGGSLRNLALLSWEPSHTSLGLLQQTVHPPDPAAPRGAALLHGGVLGDGSVLCDGCLTAGGGAPAKLAAGVLHGGVLADGSCLIDGSTVPTYPNLQRHMLHGGVLADGSCLIDGTTAPTYSNLQLLGWGTAGNLAVLQGTLGDAHAAACRGRPPPRGGVYGHLALLGCGAGDHISALQHCLGDAHLAACAAARPAVYGNLAMLGGASPSRGGDCANLSALQHVAGPAQQRACDVAAAEGREMRETRAAEAEVSAAERRLADRERELEQRERALAEKEAATMASQGPSPTNAAKISSPRQQVGYDVCECAIEDDELRALFATYDRDGSGCISRSEFKNEYRTFESFGLAMTDRQLDALFSQFGGTDDRLSFEEFAVMMLQRAKM